MKSTDNYPLVVKKYLTKYGMKGWEPNLTPAGSFSNIVVIPAINEYDNIKKLLGNLGLIDNKFFSSTLFLFCINNTAYSSAEVKNDNLKTIGLLKKIVAKEKGNGDKIIREVIGSGINIAYIDASSSGNELPEKDGGVGLARKIGLDNALKLFDYENGNKKLLIFLDADCTVENNYLTEIVNSFNFGNLSAAAVNFYHDYNDDDTAPAIISYEIFLRYYVLGLRFAGSPYAFHSIGSTIVCTVETYVKAEGMSKRKAAEDFYFLQKISKFTSIANIKSTAVHPSSRKSWRVPFGTGQRVNRFYAGTHNEYAIYDPESFRVLKKWLTLFDEKSSYGAGGILQEAEEISTGLHSFLISQDFERDWNKIVNNSKSKEQLDKQRTIWFDGFRTLKFIHYLRDSSFSMINMFDALDILLQEFQSENSGESNGRSASTCGSERIFEYSKRCGFKFRLSKYCKP